MNNLEKLLLETLSFFAPMTRTQIVLQIDGVELHGMKELTIEDMETILKVLQKRKMIKQVKLDGERAWVRRYHFKRAWWRRFFPWR